MTVPTLTRSECVSIPEPQPPGVYPGVPFEEYLAWPNISKHQLDSLARSPAHYRAALEQPRKRTAAMAFGAAVHAAVLEPDKFTERYTQAPETDKRTKLGREAHEAAATGGRVLLKIEELVAISAMVNAVTSHPFASILLNADDGEAEVSIAWVDETTGVPCRARPDFLNHAHNVCVDLKTCQDSSMGGFTRAIISYRYHVQSGFYTDGLKTNGRRMTFVFVAVETDPPYGIGCYELSPEDNDLGRVLYKRGLRVYQQCMETGVWDGYPPHVRIVELPSYARFVPIN